MPADPDVLIYAHVGDLHLTVPHETNARDLAAIVAELTRLREGLNFVFLPGDNADNGRPEQYALARHLLAPLPLPIHAITGDHDVESGGLEAFYAGLGSPRLPMALDAGGVRCLFLDMCGPGGGGPDFRLGSDQLGWLSTELRAAHERGFRCAVFMHSYPADLRGPGETAAVNAALASAAVLLVDMGHTHYNELANNGRTIFAATRSTGQIEEGSVGYSLVAIDDRVVSWRFRALGSAAPAVLITAPADRRLATDLVPGERTPRKRSCHVRASVLDHAPIASCTCRVDAGEPWAMTRTAHGRYHAVVTVSAEARSLTVEARTEDGRIGAETIEFAGAADIAHQRHADGSDADAIGAWPERGILGTQLGPNRNGRQW